MSISHLSPLASSFSSIIVSEIGDKTFFITAILGMTYSLGLVFIGSYSAMALMTILSCFFGFLLPQLIDKFYADILTCVLFLYFGQKLLRQFFSLQEEQDEEQEAREEVNNFQNKIKKQTDSKYLSQLAIIRASLILTFVAEWGDRSQITTIALATEDTYTVLIGALLGHLICTGTAVMGGKMIAQKIQEKWVFFYFQILYFFYKKKINLSGAILFLVFGFNNLKSVVF